MKKEPSFSEIINNNGTSSYKFPEIEIKVVDQTGEILIFRSQIPCSIFNLAKAIDINR